jgi:hypothetical protein
MRIMRRISKGEVKNEITIKFSDWFDEFYKLTVTRFERASDTIHSDDETTNSQNDPLDILLRLRDFTQTRLNRELDSDFFARQTYIPAGRAFFTSIGRLVAGLEHAGSLDPVTIKFARIFANMRDRRMGSNSYRLKKIGSEFLDRRKRFMKQLFGGEIKYEREIEFVETADGRKIPFPSLSSGQQELLPMWSIMENFNETEAYRSKMMPPQRIARQLFYIEEPEAHLFPSAQSLLMEYLIGSMGAAHRSRHLVITTHSPYIMGKLNVFLKAGQLARRKKRNLEISAIVPRECWVNEDMLTVCSIDDGNSIDLIDDDGLIDARYLDQISEENAQQFSSLLQIESEI